MSKSGKKGDYTVGFGKPPEQHRFKKGQSGNPKGRPKKAAKEEKRAKFGTGRVDDVLEQEIFRRLHLHENGKPIELDTVQAIIRSLMVEGLKGNRLAKKYVLELIRQLEHEAVERSIERYKYYAEKKAEGEAKIAQCEAQRHPPPRLYPHPDDILLDEAKLEVHILGPRSEDQAIPYVRAALMRDWLFARSVPDEAYSKVPTSVRKGRQGDLGFDVMAVLIERALPPSFRRSDSEARAFMLDLVRLSKRQRLQRMESLMAEAVSLPLTIEERLEARGRATTVLETLAEALKMAATTFAEKQRQASAGETSAGGPSPNPQAAPA